MLQLGNVLPLLLMLFSTTSAQFNWTEYYKMPTMFRFDEFERCLYGSEDLSVYCMVKTAIKPDNNSELWRYIKNVSDDTLHNYRHDILINGVCINRCKAKLAKLDNETYNALEVEYFDAKIKYNLNPDDFPGTREFREQYNDLITRCVNIDLKEEHGLLAYSNINYCQTNKDEDPYDLLDWTFIIITVMIIFIVLCATRHDQNLRKAKISDDVVQQSKKEQALLAFSAIRNFERLMSIPTTGATFEFRYIQAIRYLTMIIIVLGHVDIGYTGAAMLNPEYTERKYHSPWSHIGLDGTIVVQAFFHISGFLLAVHFVDDLMVKRTYNFKYFWIAVIYRYLRLTPVYAYVILYDATLMYKSQWGPLWKRTGGLEKLYCRKHWWTNLLYINNHVHVEEACMPHSWYMAADTQLFIMGMFTLMLCWKLSRFSKHILISVTTVLCIIPGVIVYIKGYDGALILPPEDKANMNQMDTFKDTYVPAYANAGSYFIGILSGYMYKKMRRANFEFSSGARRFINVFHYHIYILGIANCGLTYIFYDYKFEKPSIWMALYAILMKNMWGYLGVVATITFYSNTAGLVRKILYAPMFQMLGRITYCVYLCHFTLLRLATAEIRNTIIITTRNMLILTMLGVMNASIVGFILCLCLEFPITALLKIFIPQKRPNDVEHELSKPVLTKTRLESYNNSVDSVVTVNFDANNNK